VEQSFILDFKTMRPALGLQNNNRNILGDAPRVRYNEPMLRPFCLLLIAASLAARGSDPIPEPKMGNSNLVSQPHVTAELIPDYAAIKAGKPFLVALHLHADPDWHTYWINPGDAGLATSITWTLPPGFIAGPVQWPTPEKHDMGGLMTFGYAGDVYLLTTITPPTGPDKWPPAAAIKANAQWLVCKEECIPGHADLSFSLENGMSPAAQAEDGLRAKFFAEAQTRLPVPNTRWMVKATYEDVAGVQTKSNPQTFDISFKDISGPDSAIGNIYFFPEQGNVLSANWPGGSTPNPTDKIAAFLLELPLQQNGEKPDKLSGVLVSDQPLIGNAKAVYIPEFPVTSPVTAAVPSGGSTPPPSAETSSTSNSSIPPAPPQGIAATTIGFLGFAFVGGLILNLMPCVLPVLSLKVFSLMKHAGQNPKAAWIQGAAFTAGVVVSFWVLAGLLLTLRAAGNHLGWGFQMQSPGFVLGLIFLFFLLALNLFGVFELGTSLVGLDAKASGHLGGLASSFGNGALATLAATPCTAPFMGSALGFAAQQSAFISLLIFTFLALGMATPYLLLTIFPGALRFVPKPGAWMEAFKQFMGFLLMATVIFLVYVFGALVGGDQVPWLLMTLLLAGVAAWIYGRWFTPVHSGPVRFFAFILALAVLGYAIGWGVTLAKAEPPAAMTADTANGWQPWTPDAVAATLAKNQPVFVDFTAAWCLSCKVNERVALETDAVKQALAQKNVALFRADWTHADPAISNTLQHYHRDGVPLYLLYSPDKKDTPQVLPEVLTPGIVLDALKNL
jgi:thiol:disulfide interchange protein/DsbC/DsbD-like thiol-disulfide interchange protein